jgi:DNA-directed RNA polymerase specialized sigma24 family protein
MNNDCLATLKSIRSFHRRLAEMAEPVRAVFRSGSVTGDVWSLVSNFVPADERAAALRRLARGKYISPYFANPRVRGVVGRMLVRRLGREEAWTYIQDKILPTAIDEAVQARHEVRRIRLGRKWVKDDIGDVQTAPAAALLLGEFAQWVFQDAKRIAGENLTRDALDHSVPLEHDPPAPASEVCEPEESSEPESKRDRSHVLDALSSRERELINHVKSGARRYELARLMGVRSSTVRVWLHRINKKVRRVGSPDRPARSL